MQSENDEEELLNDFQEYSQQSQQSQISSQQQQQYSQQEYQMENSVNDQNPENSLFCFFIIGTLFPAIWGIFFVFFTWQNFLYAEPKFPIQCTYLSDWGMLMAAFLFIISLFYLFTTQLSYDQSGSTALLILIQNNYLISGQLGDSKAVLFRETKHKKDKSERITIELTEENIPTREIEKNRILSKGGVILRDACKKDEFKLQIHFHWNQSNILNHELF
ncbi:Protein phosphatase 2C (PP2C)-like domain [Pseudocohnilembus persalinus]|uniref:Protein phosphatase 2C (PP2C)-like domain n=1 Tax=Pseudocohnilembus persalinus TaxID=266149 RepID=A0A0V0QSW8_PSEPJ|nr:Protein phosphatase 2C (PP2C)-like domain [Pseudocohnilembus persalinus]|eukprot:KRX05407.1 Protein phosphatase 2C (PP2C)-like domain [Pseudocohnilembus persalinus]